MVHTVTGLSCCVQQMSSKETSTASSHRCSPVLAKPGSTAYAFKLPFGCLHGSTYTSFCGRILLASNMTGLTGEDIDQTLLEVLQLPFCVLAEFLSI